MYENCQRMVGGDIIPDWVIFHNNLQFSRMVQLTYSNWMHNVMVCRRMGLPNPIKYDYSMHRVWVDLPSVEGAD